MDVKPKWSPDGRQIAFLSNRRDEKQSQIYLIPFDGGEARPLTSLKGTVREFEWSPDGKALVCSFRNKDQYQIEREKDERKKRLGRLCRPIDRVFYKEDGEGFDVARFKEQNRLKEKAASLENERENRKLIHRATKILAGYLGHRKESRSGAYNGKAAGRGETRGYGRGDHCHVRDNELSEGA